MIVFVRHSSTEENISGRLISESDTPLNHQGKKQSQEIAKYLSHYLNIEYKIITSPILRARQTTKIICKILHCDYEISKNLSERKFGIYDGLKFPKLIELRKEKRHIFDDPSQDWNNVENVESDKEIYERIKHLIKSVEFNNQCLVFITHAGVIKSFLHEEFEIRTVNRFKINNGSIVILTKSYNGNLRLEQIRNF
ncbi:MAG: histidine phosphatase family protein [Bacteroidales bacterium]|nr:histidine phosphatase family protein [Bacteroidales bacterium]